MNASTAKREVCYLTGLLLESYFEVGQPFAECRQGATVRTAHRRTNPETCPDCDRLYTALIALRNELERRS